MKLLRRGRSIDRGDYPEYVCQVLCGKSIYTRLVAFVGFENPIGGLRLAVHGKKTENDTSIGELGDGGAGERPERRCGGCWAPRHDLEELQIQSFLIHGDGQTCLEKLSAILRWGELNRANERTTPSPQFLGCAHCE